MRRAAFALCALLSACTASTPVLDPTIAPSTSGPPSPSASPSKVRAPVAALATYASDDAIYLYDVKTNRVTEIARGEGLSLPKLVTRTQLAFLQDGGERSTTFKLVDLKTKQVTDLFTVPTGIATYGLSADHQTIGYVTVDERGYPHVEFRALVGESSPQPVATLALALGRGGSIDDQLRVEFSPDGELILVVYTHADGEPGRAVPEEQSQMQIRTLDGSLAYAVDHDRDPTMGTWSADGKRAYYRTGTDVREWSPTRPRSSREVKGGVRWYNPWPSRDGRFIAFDTGARSTKVLIRTLDLASGRRQDVSKPGLFHPVVADAKTIWAQRVQKCEPDCLDPVVAGPEVVAIDIKTKAERKLSLPTLVDVDVLYV